MLTTFDTMPSILDNHVLVKVSIIFYVKYSFKSISVNLYFCRSVFLQVSTYMGNYLST